MSVKTQLTALADVIRANTGATGTMTISEMTQTLNECKIWGLEEVSGTINLSTSNTYPQTLTISDLPFSEIFMVYVHDQTSHMNTSQSKLIYSIFVSNPLNASVTHFLDGSNVVCNSNATITYANGVLKIKTTEAVFSGSRTYTYYIMGAKA